MKKSILTLFLMALLLSSIASAGFLDRLLSGWGITGAQGLAEQGIALAKEPEVNFENSIKDGTFLKYNLELPLDNDVTLFSSYNPAKKTATLKFTKKLIVKNNKKVKFDNGYFLGKLGPDHISFDKSTDSVSVIDKILPKSTESKDSLGVKSIMIGMKAPYKLPLGRTVPLANGFTAKASKDSFGNYFVIFSKSVTVSDNTKILLPSNFVVKVTANGISFVKSPANFRGAAIVEKSANGIRGVMAPDDRPSQKSIVGPSERSIVGPSQSGY